MITLHFYRRQEILAVPGKPTWYDAIALRLLSLLRRGGPIHVTIEHDGRIYSVLTSRGFFVISADHYPMKPWFSAGMDTHPEMPSARQWMAIPYRHFRVIAQAFGLPFTGSVHSCVTEVARTIGVKSRCRTPVDILLALCAGEHRWAESSTSSKS